MGEESRRLLEEAIKSAFEYLQTLDPGSDEYTAAVENLNKLYKQKLEEDKNDIEWEDNKNRRESDDNYRRAQMKEMVKDRWFKAALAGSELAFYATWMVLGLNFEKTGSFLTQTFRNFISRFKPMK